MIPKAIKIIGLLDYTVTCMFNNGQILKIDFLPWIHSRLIKGSIYKKLLDKSVFNTISCNGRTLYWPGLATRLHEDGSKETADFDLDPVVLFELSDLKYGVGVKS